MIITLLSYVFYVVAGAALIWVDERGTFLWSLCRVFGFGILLWVSIGTERGAFGAPPEDPWPTLVAGAVLVAAGFSGPVKR